MYWGEYITINGVLGNGSLGLLDSLQFSMVQPKKMYSVQVPACNCMKKHVAASRLCREPTIFFEAPKNVGEF